MRDLPYFHDEFADSHARSDVRYRTGTLGKREKKLQPITKDLPSGYHIDLAGSIGRPARQTLRSSGSSRS